MWRSAIHDRPEPDEDHPVYPEGYDEWLEKVMAEPWVRVLEDLLKWSGVWVGTEKQLIEELKMRAGKEVSSCEDFPASYEQLIEYVETAVDGFNMRALWVLHYREIPAEDLEHYDVPEWGPESPILVYEGDAARRPNYWITMGKLLAYEDDLPLAILIFTGNDRKFRDSRRWMGKTVELCDKLIRYSPMLGLVPVALLHHVRPEGHPDVVHGGEPKIRYHPWNLLEPAGPEGYRRFHRQMKAWAPILKEMRIEISWRKLSFGDGKPAKTYWTIEAPRWEKPRPFWQIDSF